MRDLAFSSCPRHPRYARFRFRFCGYNVVMTTTAVAKKKTRDVKGRRVLSLKTIDDAIAEAERVAAADREGRARTLGNWTIGQIFGHLATWANYAFDGTPMAAPWFVRLIARAMKNRFLNKGIPAGGKIPRVPGGTFGTDVLSTDEGLERFCKAFGRLKTETPTQPSAAFGHLTPEEHVKLNLRHAELHLSFVQIEK